MNQEMGLTEFFAMEAGEYLERLDTLVSGAVGPDRDEFVRLARALRGSALMANQQHIGGVAAGLENVARGVKEERVAWDEVARQTVIRAVDGLKILVRSVNRWGDAETNRANQLTSDLSEISGLAVPEPAAKTEPTVDTGTRAFVAREGAAVASVLSQTAKAVQRDGPTENQIETVLRSMEPLRGLAALSDLSPLPEFLDGVERALASTSRGLAEPNDLALLLDVAARGLSKATQELSTAGTADPDSVEAHEFTKRLGRLLDVDAEVVPIQSLYYEDEGPHVVEAGAAAAQSSQMGQMEFVAHGEHLCQLADGLESAEGETQLDIRTISLKSTLRTLTVSRGSSLASSVAAFASVVLDSLADGQLASHKSAFVSRLRDAGTALGTTTTSNEQEQVAALTRITEAFHNLAEPVAPADGPISRPMAPSAAVSIVREEPVPVEPATPTEPIQEEQEPADDIHDLAAAWNSYESLRRRFGDGEPSIEALISGESVEQDLILITELCFSGSAALNEAQSVRNRIRQEMSASEWNADLVSELVDELLDLVELGVGQT